VKIRAIRVVLDSAEANTIVAGALRILEARARYGGASSLRPTQCATTYVWPSPAGNTKFSFASGSTRSIGCSVRGSFQRHAHANVRLPARDVAG
jgi:hypothetical protein